MRPIRLVWTAVMAALAIQAAWAAQARVTVTPADAPALKNAIAAHRGHVVVVNFWATWCGPCVEEFPALVKLQNEYRAKGLVVIAVSADMTKDVRTKVVPFLKARHADFPQFLERARDPETIIDAFDKNWQGDLPRTFIYDRTGRLVNELPDSQSLGQFEAAVRPLLART